MAGHLLALQEQVVVSIRKHAPMIPCYVYLAVGKRRVMPDPASQRILQRRRIALFVPRPRAKLDYGRVA